MKWLNGDGVLLDGLIESRQKRSSSERPASQNTDIRVRMKSAWFSGVPLLLIRTKTSDTSSSEIFAFSSSAVNGKLVMFCSLRIAVSMVASSSSDTSLVEFRPSRYSLMILVILVSPLQRMDMSGIYVCPSELRRQQLELLIEWIESDPNPFTLIVVPEYRDTPYYCIEGRSASADHLR